MIKYIVSLFLSFFTISAIGQSSMRPVEELINTTDPGWRIVRGWIDSAKNSVEILQSDPIKAKEALYRTQVTTRSPMGAVIYATGGILIDNGWIRILGSGSKRLDRSLPDWNKGKTFTNYGDHPAFLLVADDVIGGFYAINGGELGKDAGKIYYLAPDNLKWEPLNLTYSDFLNFCFNGDIAKFYENLRWTDWRKDVLKIDGNSTYSFYPLLWTAEGKDINKVTRKSVPVEEQYISSINGRKQLRLD